MKRDLVTSCIMLLLAGCGGTQPAAAPSAVPPSPEAPPTATGGAVRGIVYEITADGRRPLPGAGIDISPEYQSWPPKVMTDADGRFSLAGAAPTLPTSSSGPYLKIIAIKHDYSQPCRVPVQDVQVDHEVYLVSNDLLSTRGTPSSMPIAGPVLTGRVFEHTSNGQQPVARASITLDFTGGDGWAPSATTITDAAGRYLLCNFVDATRLGIAASIRRDGYRDVFARVPLPSGGTFDFELQQQ